MRSLRVGRVISLVLSIIALAPGGVEAQIPPDERWVTIESVNFRVTFPPELEELARHAARRAEVAWQRLSTELEGAPGGKVDIVLTDYVDISNGYATPFPSNRIILYAPPPASHLSLSNFSDWIDLVVTHELAHIFHLDRTGWLGGGLRSLFGRVPVTWPLFPVLGTPTWSVEGFATYMESRLTGAGRVHGSYNEMVLRTAVLEDAFAPIDLVSGTSATWPGGARPYIYGSLFLQHLSERYGPGVQRELIDAVTRASIPPPFLYDRLARKATGRPFTTLFEEWQRDLETRYQHLADSLAAEGVTRTERISGGGQNTLHPRVGVDGRVAYISADGRRSAANRVVDPSTGTVHDLSRRNDLGPIAWFPDGALLTAQVEYRGRYRVYSDLYRVDDEGEHRLTRGARLIEPDLARDGRRVVAVQGGGGTNQLIIYHLDDGTIVPITDHDPAIHWSLPRWSPAGDQIAVGRWEGGRHDVVIIDTLGTIEIEVTAGSALDASPAWSADGRYLILSSDRTGITNLFAYDLSRGAEQMVGGVSSRGYEEDESIGAGAAEPRVFQITNLLTGAFFPDPSPDGRWIYFSGYHADGFHIERIPFEPERWRVLPARSGEGAHGVTYSRVADDGPEISEPGPVRRYSPLHSLLPRYWIPLFRRESGAGAFLGAATSGTDLIGRHTYSVSAGYQPRHRLIEGALDYSYAGLGNPELGLTLRSGWEGLLLSGERPDGSALLRRDDELILSTTLLRQRYRSAAQLTLAGEGVDRGWFLVDGEGARSAYPRQRLVGAVVQGTFVNYRSQPFSISHEDGIGLSVTGRRRWELARVEGAAGELSDAGYDEIHAQFRGYKSLDFPGFANHVIALRASGLWRRGGGASTTGVGGASGDPLDLRISNWGGGRIFLPVRGFSQDQRRGTQAWSASLEYRFPITLVGRGAGLIPVFLDRIHGSIFLDAGDAGCGRDAEEGLAGLGICPEGGRRPLISSGAELTLDSNFLFGARLGIRGGIALPIEGRSGEPSLYLRIGLPF